MRRQVRVRQGIVEGLATEDPTITAFRGIPFAQPPIGGLRWREPRPALPWNGVLQAYDFAPIAMQPMSNPQDFYGKEWQMDPDTPMSEDCLYVNVWTPALSGRSSEASVVDSVPKSGLPVMVWIYGGGYQTGATAEKEFNGAYLARNGVVVVSIAYRLNVFGFFAHRDLEDESGSCPCANFGLLDQRAGIAWVKENIAAFGGDPNNITMFGQSAGAASVLAQSCSPMNERLFNKVIMQSGGGVGVFNEHIWSLESAQRNGDRFLKFIGVETVRQARRIPAQQLLEAALGLPACEWNNAGADWAPLTNWTPCIDGIFLTEQYAQTIEAGHQQVKTMLVGNTTNEFLATRSDGAVVAQGERGNLDLIDLWNASHANSPYYYRFDVAMPGDDAGAFHSSDLWFSFGTLGMCWRPFEGWHFGLSRMMMEYWTNFAATGDPNVGLGGYKSTLPRWEPCENEIRAMHLGKQVECVDVKSLN